MRGFRQVSYFGLPVACADALEEDRGRWPHYAERRSVALERGWLLPMTVVAQIVDLRFLPRRTALSPSRSRISGHRYAGTPDRLFAALHVVIVIARLLVAGRRPKRTDPPSRSLFRPSACFLRSTSWRRCGRGCRTG